MRCGYKCQLCKPNERGRILNIKPVGLIMLVLSMAGCFTPKAGTIKSADADYVAMKKSAPTIIETRVFVKKDSSCNYQNNDNEAAVEVAVASFLINFAADKVEEAIKKEAAYLNSEVASSGSSLLSVGDSAFWPSVSVLNNYSLVREAKVDDAAMNARFEYLDAHPATKEDDAAMAMAIKAARDDRGAEFDRNTPQVTAKMSESLCVLAILGEYADKGIDREMLESYMRVTDAKEQSLSNYSLIVPGMSPSGLPKPFAGLVKDPTLVVEIQVIPVGKKDTVQYFVVPKNLFYANPLHKHTLGGLERNINITLTLGDRTPTLILEKMRSGNYYSSRLLATKGVSFEAPREKAFQSVQVRIGEGSDSMPTADFLTAAAGKKTEVAKALIEKATEMLTDEEDKKK